MTRRAFFAQKQRKLRYRTVEIYHPTIGVNRYVRKQQEPVNLTLEANAPRNAGESVQFDGAFFQYTLPEQSDSTISAEIQFGQVGRTFKQEIKKIKGTDRTKTGEVIIREWVKGETSPDFVLELYVATIATQSNGAVILATQDDPSNKGVSQIYTTSRFPGLKESL
ncbi:MAG: hypothetical protein VYC55_08060 [Pseudomonadota bacterium]|nr:hypothetical protein [Pseudomonadota bacterium]